MGMVSEARNGNIKMKNLGSVLVVQRSRYHHFEVFCEIYKMGMNSEVTNILNRNNENKNTLGSDVVEQRSRYHHVEVSRELQDGHDFRGNNN